MLFETQDGRLYFAYSSHKTRDRADECLEDYYAEGLICVGEAPFIHAAEGRYHVMFPA